MPSRTYTRRKVIGATSVELEYFSQAWQQSPVVNGKLRLVANPFSLEHRQLRSFRNSGEVRVPTGVTAPNSQEYSNAVASAEQISYARLRGRLYKGSAALGVTLGTYRQSREMIVKTYQRLDQSIEELYARVMRNNRAGRNSAGLYLEYVFGWVPLINDIRAACSTVVQMADTRDWVSGVAKSEINSVVGSWNQYVDEYKRESGSIRVTRATAVEIQNPNRWLLERAGLLNPVTVLWDLVPWSFVVNMFVNTGTLVQSITDFAGLSFSNGSTTYSHNLQIYCVRNEKYAGGQYRESGGLHRKKHRVLGAISQPPLVMKLPNANWELAAIAASLVTQKVTGLPFGRR